MTLKKTESVEATHAAGPGRDAVTARLRVPALTCFNFIGDRLRDAMDPEDR